MEASVVGLWPRGPAHLAHHPHDFYYEKWKANVRARTTLESEAQKTACLPAKGQGHPFV